MPDHLTRWFAGVDRNSRLADTAKTLYAKSSDPIENAATYAVAFCSLPCICGLLYFSFLRTRLLHFEREG